MICSLSGQACEEPVVSKFGHCYEKRLIEKYLETHDHKDPATGEPLAATDLITVKVNKIVKPRPATATSIPSLLQVLQNEWDSLMLETYTLKQQLETARQELAQSLYQHDAACRVIARLTKERNEARSALANARAAMTHATAAAHHEPASAAAAVAPAGMDVDRPAAAAGLPAEALDRLTKTGTELLTKRKKREVPATLASPDTIKTFKSGKPVADLHAAGKVSLELSSHDANLAITGGIDGRVTLLDISTGKARTTIDAHKAAIHKVALHATEEVAFTASADKTASSWVPEGGRKKGWKLGHTFRHSGEVTSVSIHPVGDYIGTASLDRTWALQDIRTGATLASFAHPDAGVVSGTFHPDGLLYAAAIATGPVRIWDLKAGKIATSLSQDSQANAVAISENGYHVATASEDGLVKLWDLRKQSVLQSLTLPARATAVHFDLSGSYLAAAGGSEIRLVQSKTFDAIAALSGHTGAVSDVKWGKDALSLVSVGVDRSLRVFKA